MPPGGVGLKDFALGSRIALLISDCIAARLPDAVTRGTRVVSMQALQASF